MQSCNLNILYFENCGGGQIMDLYFGILMLAAASVATLGLGSWIGCRVSAWSCDLLAVGVVAMAGIYGHVVWQRVAVAQAIPFSNLIIVGNWLPLFASFVVGLAWQRIPGGVIRKASSTVGLFASAWFVVVFPLLGDAPRCADVWSRDGFCLQTTDQTCSAASAASLLRSCGIRATEQEMADLCLTRDGTTWQGLYRGLKLKTHGTKWDVRVVRGGIDALLAEAAGPIILSVGLAAGAEVDGAYEREFGWKPGIRHSVLMLGRGRANRIEIVDPNPQIGRESWTVDDLSLLYRGPAIRLVPRKKTPSS